MRIPGLTNLPNVPMPKQARVEELNKAVWDYLRTGLSFDEANTVKHGAEANVRALLDGLMTRTKAQEEAP